MASSYLDKQLGAFLDLVSSREAAPGGGAVAALTVSLAAGLAAMAARLSSRQFADSSALADEADRIRRRSAELADDDSVAYREVLAAYEAAKSGTAAGGADDVATALHTAARVPLEVTALGAQTAALAARLVLEGNPKLRGDATTAAFLAEAAVRSAAHLVRINVEDGDGDTSLVEEAEQNVRDASVVLGTLRT